jgi:hypothetical protein
VGTCCELLDVVVGQIRRDSATAIDNFLQFFSGEFLHHVHLLAIYEPIQCGALALHSPADQLADVRVGRCAAAGVDVKLRATVACTSTTDSILAQNRGGSPAAHLPHGAPSRLRLTRLLDLDNDRLAVLVLALVHAAQALRTFRARRTSCETKPATSTLDISYVPTVPSVSLHASPTRSRSRRCVANQPSMRVGVQSRVAKRVQKPDNVVLLLGVVRRV